MRYFIVF